MLKRSDVLTLGAAILVIAGFFLGVDGSLYQGALTDHQAYSFWTAWPIIGSYALVVAAGWLIVSALRGWPIPPWQGATFPDLEIEINGCGIYTVPSEHPDGWLVFSLRITNRESDQIASLTIRYRGKFGDNKKGLQFGETIFTAPKGDPPEKVPADWLSFPLNVLPQHSVGGNYVALLSWSDRTNLEVPSQGVLLIEDHTSGRAITVPAKELRINNSANWTPLEKDPSGYFTVFPPLVRQPS
jgi:hypothetical protein